MSRSDTKTNRFAAVIQEKGGVAKTFLAVHLVAWLESCGVRYRPVDLDLTAGVLTRVYPPPLTASISPDVALLRSGESLMPQLMERVLKGERFLVDCGANTGEAWSTLFNDVWIDLPQQLEANGVKTVIIVPVTSDEKTTTFFEHYKKTLFSFATVVMVKVREYREEQFETPDHPRELIIDLPLAPPRLFTVYRKRALPVDRIAESTDQALALDRGFARGYLPQLHQAFSRIKPLLTP